MRAFCFTLNNYGEADLDNIQASELYSYGIVGKEVGEEEKTPHLQGYLQLKKQTRKKAAIKALAKLCSNHPHVTKADGTAAQNRVYCSKGDDFTEWGEARSKGKRMDLIAMRDAIKGGASWVQLAEEHTACHARYHKWGDRYAVELKIEAAKAELKAAMELVKLRVWQQSIIDLLDKQGDREVLWVVDSIGGKGKSFLAKWLCVMRDAFYVESGKKADISYAYAFQKTVVFDLSRATEKFVNYSTIESFKNGIIFSPKYASTTKFFTPAKIVVFSNWAPDRSQLSEDR